MEHDSDLQSFSKVVGSPGTHAVSRCLSTIIPQLAEKIKRTFGIKVPQTPADLPCSFEFIEVDESTILRELAALKTNKATGLDQINAKLLKDSAYSI